MKNLFTTLVLLAGLVITSSAHAGDLIISRSVLEDRTGVLTIAAVAKSSFAPVGHTLSKGYTDSVHWLRLQVRAPSQTSPLVLYIRQPYLNEISLYEVDAHEPSGWKSRVTGNHYPYNVRDRARPNLGFVINVTAPEATYYLRLKTRSASQLSVEGLTLDEAEQRDHQFDLVEVFFVTSMVLLLLWALHSYLLDRLPIVGLFAIHQAVYTCFGIAITGYLAPYIPTWLPLLEDLSTAVFYCGLSFTTLLFCRELFKPYEPPPVLMRGMNLFLLIFPLQLAAIALGYTPLAVITNAILMKVSWWYFAIMAFTLRRELSPSRRTLQLLFVTITLFFTLIWTIGNSSTNKNSLLSRQILLVNGLMIGSIFAMILNARSRRLLLEAQQSANELKAKSEFLALISHEIRTPLNALVGFSSLARTATDTAKLDQYHTILEQSSRSLMELVNDILDMSKIEAGRMELEYVPFNLHQLVKGLEEQYQPLADQKELTFQAIIADKVPAWVLGDPVHLRQILVNLIANAVKFTNSGKVTCSVGISPHSTGEGQSPQIRFEVRDTGIGIPVTSRALLFQPFRQLDSSTARKFGGTGLGLAIVNNLVKNMRGTIIVDSQEGVGSCFIVDLPLQETEPLAESPATAVAMASGTILVAEDNQFNRQLLSETLTSWGQQVILAEDGIQALQFMEQQHFDLILLDIRMPGIDGIEVARRMRLREQERSEKPVPIIAVTADADTVTVENCRAVGINAVLAKPVNPTQLCNVIAAHCQGMKVPSHVEELLLNEQTHSDLAGNPERARQYQELLLADIDDELNSLQSAFERDERLELGRAAHTLKGLCGHLANSEPAKLAAWLQLNAPTAGHEDMRAAIEQLQSTLTQENNA